MAAFFASASSQSLQNAASPITAYPFTVGLWVYPTTTGATRTILSIASLANTTNGFEIFNSSTGAWGVGTYGTNATTGTTTLNAWHFLLARFISATNRKLSVLKPDGGVINLTTATSSTPTGVTMMALGVKKTSGADQRLWDGSIGEFWYTATDIQPDGAQISDATVRQLAYGGPLSLPHIAGDILEYRSLRASLTADQDQGSEIYAGGAGRQTWANVNGAIVGAHPPLPYWYVKPAQVRKHLTV